MESQTAVPVEVWDQDVSQGGAVSGDLPNYAAPVIVEGVAAVRDVPTMAATFGLLTIPQGTSVRIGRNGRRRSLIVSVRPNVVATAYAVLAENASQAVGGYGLPILQGVAPVNLPYAGELHIAANGADVVVGFIAFLDEG